MCYLVKIDGILFFIFKILNQQRVEGSEYFLKPLFSVFCPSLFMQ